jgi:rhamnogalacturonan endolyase
MHLTPRFRAVLLCALAGAHAAFSTSSERPLRQMEALDRGVVALPREDGTVFVGWRLLGTEPADLAFNLYRASPAGIDRLNSEPLTGPTHFLDRESNPAQPRRYFVRPVVAGRELSADPAGGEFHLPAHAPARPYLALPLDPPPGGTSPDGVAYSYRPGDASAGDLTGDGSYEIVLKWDPSNAKDNAHSGHTGPVFLDAYRLDGTRLWRLNLGPNIRAGAHYTQFLVYDFSGDGRAELVCKTADGTIDGTGRILGDPAADHRNEAGYVLRGPEFLTVFDGRTGAALATVDYVPPRHPETPDPSPEQLHAVWGDGYGNRVDRFLAAVAYLDGERPSIVMARGYYTRTVLAAWDWRDGRLTPRWVFDSDDGTPGNLAYRGQGNHQLAVADLTGDGRDDIVYGACAIDADGRGLHRTGLHHGDALHVSDLDPTRPGLEIFMPHESPGANGGIGTSFRDARTGELLWTTPAERDVGRGMAFDIDPRHPGHEVWATNSPHLYNARGEVIAATRPPQVNFAVWWSGGLLRDLLDRNRISRWNWETAAVEPVFELEGATSINGTKATPALSADLFGDWREEIIMPSVDGRELRIYSPTEPTVHRIYTLMHDPVYRLSVAWQNVAYNQPPHPGFFLGHGMAPPPRPAIRLVRAAP